MISEVEIPNGGDSKRSQGSGLYVDVENLRADGQRLIETLIASWPSTAPALVRLTLYVRADLVELWRLWATSQFQSQAVVVKGIQHFSTYSSKNSADIAIATNAMADLLLKRIDHVVVLSDDSDFISLYVAIRDELNRSQSESTKVPFLWVVTDREDTVSSTVKQFFPTDQLYVVSTESSGLQQSRTHNPLGTSTAPDVQPTGQDLWKEIAQAIVEQIPVGKFKSTDCQGVIKKYWPQHPMAVAGGPAFGIEFQKSIWPILDERGAKIVNPGKKPIRYEMTEDAKRVST